MTYEKRRVLIVDDSVTSLDLASAALSDAGFEAHTLSSIFDLQGSMQTLRPHVLVMDLFMPALRGDLALNVLRKGGGHTCAVLLYSSAEEEVLRVRALAARADGYVRKSSDLSKLVRAVHQLAQRTAP
jgi:DNA-binding response OmpR family regulator